MTPGIESPPLDLSAGLQSKKNVDAAIDLSAGMVSKRKTPPRLDLSGGLAPKRRSPGSATNGKGETSSRVVAPGADPVSIKSKPRDEAAAASAKSASVEPFATAKSEPAGTRKRAPMPAEPLQSFSVESLPQPTTDDWRSLADTPLDFRENREGARVASAPPTRGRNLQVGLTGVRAAEPDILHASTPDAPAMTSDRVPSGVEWTAPATVSRCEEAPQPEESPYEEITYSAATRISGLRNLLLSLGMKSLNQSPDDEEVNSATPPPFHSVPRQVRTRAVASPQPDSAGSSPTLVTASPEFLPPKPVEKHPPANGRSALRREKRETYDEIEILPSWRGQYKTKPRSI